MYKPALLTLGLAAGLCALSACEGTTGPNFAPVPEEPGEATLAAFASSPVREPSAFDAVTTAEVRPDQTPEWDFVFALDGGGTAELRPRSAVIEEPSQAGLQAVERSFSELTKAPRSGYTADAPVVVEEGAVLVGRSRQDPSFGINCPHFFKVEILTLDLSEGTVTFRHLVNPACNRRNLVPGSSNQG